MTIHVRLELNDWTELNLPAESNPIDKFITEIRETQMDEYDRVMNCHAAINSLMNRLAKSPFYGTKVTASYADAVTKIRAYWLSVMPCPTST